MTKQYICLRQLTLIAYIDVNKKKTFLQWHPKTSQNSYYFVQKPFNTNGEY